MIDSHRSIVLNSSFNRCSQHSLNVMCA